MKLGFALIGAALLLCSAKPAAAQWEDPMPMTTPTTRSPTAKNVGTALIVTGSLVTAVGLVVISSGIASQSSDCGFTYSNVPGVYFGAPSSECVHDQAVVTTGVYVISTGTAIAFAALPFMMWGASSPEAQSSAMVAGGTAMTTLGLGSIGAGLMLDLFASSQPSNARVHLAVPALIAGGAVVGAGGIVMYVIGNRHERRAPAPNKPDWIGAPEVGLAPGFVSMRWVY